MQTRVKVIFMLVEETLINKQCISLQVHDRLAYIVSMEQANSTLNSGCCT